VERTVGERHAELVWELLQQRRIGLVTVCGGISQDAHRLAAEGPRDDRAVLARLEDALFESGHGACFGSRDEPRADPHAVGSQGQCCDQSTPVEDPTGRDHGDRTADGVDYQRDQWHRRHRAGVATSLSALSDDDVASGVERPLGVLDLAAHRDDQHVVLVTEVDDVAWHAESRDEGAGTAFDQQFDVVDQSVGERREQVDAERPVGETLGLGDLVGEVLARHG
jgi:hypothetical protein